VTRTKQSKRVVATVENTANDPQSLFPSEEENAATGGRFARGEAEDALRRVRRPLNRRHQREAKKAMGDG
jgi:hypothetical protein